MGCWTQPECHVWMERLNEAVRAAETPIILVGHSLGCLAIAWWATSTGAETDKIDAALLVAPPDVDRPDAHPKVRRFAPSPSKPLPFRSVLVASRNDEYAEFSATARLATTWGSELIDIGRCGHINALSGIGDWPQGEKLLDTLLAGRGAVEV